MLIIGFAGSRIAHFLLQPASAAFALQFIAQLQIDIAQMVTSARA